MPKATLSRDGANNASDTLAEVPSSSPLPSGSFAPPFTDTEVEEINGRPALKPGEADKEVFNRRSTEAEPATGPATLEDPGSEAAVQQTEALDAIFASYPELLAQMRVRPEVIIGTDDRVRINPTTSFPWRAVCALKITAQNNSRWIGTGWLVAPRTVITAGHCVYMHDQGGWAKSIEVIPGLNDNLRPYGSCVGTAFRSVTGWTQNKNRENDYGAIVLPTNCRPGDQAGYFGYAVKDDSYLLASVLNLSGYPGDKGGNQQWFMALKPKSVSSRVITYDIDTMGGQSGAPVWIKVGESRYCVGIHTNGDNAGNSATRIVTAVFNNIQAWKQQGM